MFECCSLGLLMFIYPHTPLGLAPLSLLFSGMLSPELSTRTPSLGQVRRNVQTSLLRASAEDSWVGLSFALLHEEGRRGRAWPPPWKDVLIR